jgi:hypothetical protein
VPAISTGSCFRAARCRTFHSRPCSTGRAVLDALVSVSAGRAAAARHRFGLGRSLSTEKAATGSGAAAIDVAGPLVPLGHRRAIRTTNLLERLFGEERRRTKVIPHAFFGERAVLKLMYAALIRAAECWRAIRIIEFERRQWKAIREQINQAFSTRNAPANSSTVTAANPFIQQGRT